jgi:hypothetical protein
MGTFKDKHAWVSAIASVLSAVTGIGGFYLLYKSSPTPLSNDRLMIYATASKRMSNFSEALRPSVNILINGQEEQDVKLFIYIVEFKANGDRALVAQDFNQPISGSVPADRKIIAVLRSSDTQRPVRVDAGGGMEDNVSPPLEFTATREGDQTFKIEPPSLMNSGDWFKVEIYTAARTDAQTPPAPMSSKHGGHQKAEKEITWACHVKNVQCPAEFTLDLNRPRLNESMWFLRVRVNHHGWAIYFIIIFALVNLIALLQLAKKAGIVESSKVGKGQPFSLREILLISVAFVLSLSVAEVAADKLFNGSGLDRQPHIAWVVWVINLLCFFGLIVVRKLTQRRVKAASVSPSGVP